MALQAASSGIRLRARTVMPTAPSNAADAHVLEFGELQQPVAAALAADAAFLHASKRRDFSGDESGVETDDAVFEGLGDPPGTRQVPGVHVGGQAEFRVVGEPDGLLVRVDAKQR